MGCHLPKSIPYMSTYTCIHIYIYILYIFIYLRMWTYVNTTDTVYTYCMYMHICMYYVQLTWCANSNLVKMKSLKIRVLWNCCPASFTPVSTIPPYMHASWTVQWKHVIRYANRDLKGNVIYNLFTTCRYAWFALTSHALQCLHVGM